MGDQKKSNFQNFILIQNQIIESTINDERLLQQGNIATVLTIDELFEFLEQHFSEFHEIGNLNAVLPFMHRCLKHWANRDVSNHDIGIILLYFLEQHKDDEKDLNVAVQVMFQVLNSVKSFDNKEITIVKKAFELLSTLLPTTTDRKLVSNGIACLQLYVNMFPENCKLLLALWSDLLIRLKEKTQHTKITKDTDIEILIQLFDEFNKSLLNIHDDPTIVETIQQLLKSEQREDRKCGYYLFKKMLQCITAKFVNISIIWLSSDQCQQFEQSWRLYITILENLEDNQSHLILPSLQNLDDLIKNKQLPQSWLDILYMRIITHNNNLVLRWAMEYFLQNFQCSDLSTDTIKYLLETSNSNLLYNHESYFINLKYFSEFLQGGNLIKIYTLLGDINWKSIPLYIWLDKLSEKDTPTSLTYELILKIASRVRALQNCTIREKSISICNKLFKVTIDKMSMEEYVTYVETLYNSKDEFTDHDIVYSKKESLLETKKENVFKQRFFEIFGNWMFKRLLVKFKLQKLIDFLNDIPIEQHGWLRFILYHFINLLDNAQLLKFNNVDVDSLKSCELRVIIREFVEDTYLSPRDKQEITQCHQAAISFYINQMETFDNVNDETLRIIFASEITYNNLHTLCLHLRKTTVVLNTWIIDEFLKQISNANPYLMNNVKIYLNNKCKNIWREYVQTIEDFHPSYHVLEKEEVLKLPNQTRFFYDNVIKGESRIEQLYCYHQFDKYFSDSYNLKYLWLYKIRTDCDIDYISYLIKCHKELTKKKPRYFENSNEHRFKLRIAIGIYYGIVIHQFKSTEIFDDIWDILLNENNQLNVTYIYELLLGTHDDRKNVIVEKLKQAHTLTSCQQVSIITVTYIFCLERSIISATKEIIVSNLLSLTMGANFQTRLFAQMTLYQLLKDKFNDVSKSKQIVESIENAAGKKLHEYLNDTRIHMSDFRKNCSVQTSIIDVILYVTNAPFDEILSPFFKTMLSDTIGNKMDKCRETFLKKFKGEIDISSSSKSEINVQLQRKMNPVNDVTEPNNLIIYPIEEKHEEMFVIASLIDKLPNLGGIARTCEVLGINNLVMDSKMHIEKNDFKNLSMTAEKSLNIIEVQPKDLREFLMNKQLQGFKVVGAEQTNNSQNFSNFEFPKKCLLLLGHEKDGIPAPLLGLLDYAVEIPQFGQVRSLNVHVTGALFMWEYCKQHLLQK